MYASTLNNWKVLLGTGLVAVILFAPDTTFAQDDGNVLYLSEYLYGDYYYARLGDVDRSNPRSIRPRKLRLGRKFRAGIELGTHDVSYNGKEIVFAARNTADYDWDIYVGKLDLQKKRIRNVRRIIGNIGVRDEDPRYSWDGAQIVYKCGGNICIYPDFNYANPVVTSWCELWAPSFDLPGYKVSYTKRCGGSSDDKIWQYDLLTGSESALPSTSGSADRYSQFLDDGRILYSRIDFAASRSSLWIFDSGYALPLHDRTESDDDPYPDKHDREHIAFIGWKEGGYDLYIYRQSLGNSVQVSHGQPVLWPVLFRQSE